MCRVYVGSVVSLEGQWRIYTAYPAGEQVVYTYLYFCKKKNKKNLPCRSQTASATHDRPSRPTRPHDRASGRSHEGPQPTREASIG